VSQFGARLGHYNHTTSIVYLASDYLAQAMNRGHQSTCERIAVMNRLIFHLLHFCAEIDEYIRSNISFCLAVVEAKLITMQGYIPMSFELQNANALLLESVKYGCAVPELLPVSGLRPHPINYLKYCCNGLHNCFIDILTSKLLLDLVRMPPNSFQLQDFCKLSLCGLSRAGRI
jgi:hypothetical protein